MNEDEKKSLTVYVMGENDLHVGITGRDEAPIAIVIPKANLGIGLPLEIAAQLHDALCSALSLLDDEVVQEKKELLN